MGYFSITHFLEILTLFSVICIFCRNIKEIWRIIDKGEYFGVADRNIQSESDLYNALVLAILNR